jgi:anti-sigma factor RsiW
VTGDRVPRDTEQDERLVQYLLGELPDEERDQLEAEYLGNSELHDELVAVEDELIYAYVGGRLSPSQSSSFERFFLQTHERRSRVDFARSFTQFLEANPSLQSAMAVPRDVRSSRAIVAVVNGPEEAPDARERSGAPPIWKSFWTKTVAWGKNPIVRLAFATVIVAISLISYLRIHPTGKPQLAQRKSDAIIQKNGQQSTPIHSPDSPSSPVDSALPKVPQILAFTLLATERNSGEGNLLTIPQGDYMVRLRLQPFDDIYPNYRAKLSTPEQSTVARGQLRGRPAQQPYVEFASKVLAAGDYILRLYGNDGASPSGQSEELAAYAFRVVREHQK